MKHGLLAILALTGCGTTAEFLDGGAGDDDPPRDATLADGGVGSIEVVAFGWFATAGEPREGLPVLFHDASGTLITRAVTDADGRARAEVAGGGTVTVIDEDAERIVTIVGTEPGDVLTVGMERGGGAAIGTAHINLPAGGAAYQVATPCAQGNDDSASLDVAVTDVCGAAGPLLATRNPGPGTDGFVYVPSASVAVDATVDVAGPWQAPGSVPAALTDIASGSFAFASLYVIDGGLRVLASSTQLPAPVGGTIDGSLPYPSGAGDASLVSVVVGSGSQYQTYVDHDGTEAAALTLDAAALLPVPTLGAVGPSSVAWEAAAGHDGTQVTLTGVGPKGNQLGRWTFIAPASARAVELPTLPADLAAAWQPLVFRTSIAVVESSAIEGDAAFRAAPAFGAYLPFVVGASLRVRTAGFSQ